MRVRSAFFAGAAALLAAFVLNPAAVAEAPSPAAYTTTPAISEGPSGRVALGGPWTVRIDPFGHGADKGWQAGAFRGGGQIAVPHAANATPVTGRKGLVSFRGSIAWYRTTFTVPTDGVYAIRFESVNHRSTVWIDGVRVGANKGHYVPFEFRRRLSAGETHTLVVRADWRGPSAMKADGWHRTWFNFGGIHREVTVRPIGQSELTTPTFRTRVREGLALVDVTVHVRNRGPTREVPVTGALVRGGTRIPLTFPTLAIREKGTKVVHAQADVPNPALWSPEQPNLYDLELSVPGESDYKTRVGLRELTWEGRRLFINGKRVFMKGASIHEDVRGKGDALSPADMDRIVADLKSIGANATRSQHPLNPALLERLDAAGIMIWQGIGPVDAPGAWTSKTPRLRAQGRMRVRKNFFQAQTHPSVVAWNLANEVAGNGHDAGQRSFISGMARELHRRDPGRLVGLDVWGAHPPRKPGLSLYDDIDAIGLTNYVGWYEATHAGPAGVSEAIREKVRHFQRVFPGKVIVVTEFGAEGNTRNRRGKHGSMEYQAALMARHIRTYSEFPDLSGALVWNLRDFAVSPAFAGGSIRRLVPGIKITRGLNQKGLFTYAGRRKPAADAVKREFDTLER